MKSSRDGDIPRFKNFAISEPKKRGIIPRYSRFDKTLNIANLMKRGINKIFLTFHNYDKNVPCVKYAVNKCPLLTEK